ncbi:MAG: ornithine carbamoyltransferase [Gammaproteobacteria bacterium]|nr:ornithine carbamoyltransferase [Gammaproteobacteria bacterium]
MQPQHFLSLLDLSSDTLNQLILRAIELKAELKQGKASQTLGQKTLGMIFDKSSTRTRVSFEVGMTQMGGHAIFLSGRDTQLGRGEPLEDSAKVLSRMVDIILIRTFSQQALETFAAHSQVPVINALTDAFHPCQLLADVQTYHEHRGPIEGKKVAWIGDGNNMCHSYINAAVRFGFHLTIATPKGYEPQPEVVKNGNGAVTLCHDPHQAASAADLVTTDVWASMGQEEEQKQRERDFAGFMVDEALMAEAAEDALFLHCLPAHRGEEVSSGVIDGSQSVVWDQAENRLHAQKALLEYLLQDRTGSAE